MALVSTDDRHYKNIAQAIRNKLGTEELLLPEQMAGAINSISGFMKNYQGTTIHADDTYYCNMVANRNKIEVLGQTIQNCLDHSSSDKFSELQGTIEDGYIKIVADGSSPKVASIKKDNGIIKPSTTYTFIVEILENTLTGDSASIVFENRVSSSTCFDGGLAISPVIGKKGVHKLSFTSKADIVSGVTLASACAVTLASNVTGTIKFRYAIVEGDWTNKEISFVPFGLNYPQTTEIVEDNGLEPDDENYQKRTININKPLASVSDTIRDKYYVKDGKKYHEQNVKTLVFDGSADDGWVYYSKNDNFIVFRRPKETDAYGINKSDIDLRCNLLPSIISAWNVNNNHESISNDSNGSVFIQIAISRLETPDLAGLKKWFSLNNMYMTYRLATPITTEIETEDWYSFNEQTNITTTNEVKTPMDLDIPTALVISSGKEM